MHEKKNPQSSHTTPPFSLVSHPVQPSKTTIPVDLRRGFAHFQAQADKEADVAKRFPVPCCSGASARVEKGGLDTYLMSVTETRPE